MSKTFPSVLRSPVKDRSEWLFRNKPELKAQYVAMSVAPIGETPGDRFQRISRIQSWLDEVGVPHTVETTRVKKKWQ